MQKNLVSVHKDFYVKANYWGGGLRFCSQLFHLFKICLFVVSKEFFFGVSLFQFGIIKCLHSLVLRIVGLYLGGGAVGCPDNTEVHHEKRKSNVVCNASRSGIDLFRCQEG